MEITVLSPRPVMDRGLQLEEVNKRLEDMLTESEQYSQHQTFPQSYHPPLDQNSTYDGSSLTLDSDHQFTNSTSSPLSSLPETPDYSVEQTANEEISSPSSFQGDFVPDQNAAYSMESNDSHSETPEYISEQGANEEIDSQDSFEGDIVSDQEVYSIESDDSLPETPEYSLEEAANEEIVSPNCYQDVIYQPESNHYNHPENQSLPPDHTFDAFSQHSLTQYPEYIPEEAAHEEIVSPKCYQGDFVSNHDAAVYPPESNDYIQPAEHQSLAPPDHTYDAFPQHSLTPQYQQNVYDGYKGANDLGGGMDYSQVTSGIDNYAPAPAHIIHHQDILPQQLQVYELKQIPVLVPVTTPQSLVLVPVTNQVMDHSRPYIVSTTWSSTTTVTQFTVKEVTTTTSTTTNFYHGGQQHLTPLATSGANVYGIPSPDFYPPPQEQQTPPSYSHYSGLCVAPGSIPTANAYEQQAWS